MRRAAAFALALALVVELELVLVPAPVAADEPRTIDERPWSVRFDGGVGSPVGFFGGVVGRTVQPSLAVEIGGGWGLTGVQIAALARAYLPVGDSATSSWTVAGGPSVALLSGAWGWHIYHRDDVMVSPETVYHMVMVNAEVGYELRMRWGGVLRVALGGYLNLDENISALCEPDPGSTAEPSGCEPPGHVPSAPEVARRRVLPYFAFGYGFAW